MDKFLLGEIFQQSAAGLYPWTFIFLVYINDLAVGLRCRVKLFVPLLFADDILFTVVEDSNTAACDMNHDLDLISRWAHTWRMSSNPDSKKTSR